MLKKLLVPILLLVSAWASLSLPGCKPREEELQTSGALEFSADTVKFDTVFTTLRTVTKRLWVYNRNPKAVSIDLISLDNPAASPYTLLISGDLKQTATGVYLRGRDSLLILVRAQLKDNGQSTAAKNLVVQENLNFHTNGQDQHVLLRSFGQNIYLYDNVQFTRDAVWTNDRPHVLYHNVVVPAGITLRIKPGTRVYAHAGARLIVQGTLRVNDFQDFMPGSRATDTIKATNAGIVRFSGDRLEAQYATAPGQWTGILLDASSRNNLIRYAQIQNATIGVLLSNPNSAPVQPDVSIQNSVIRYISGTDVSFAGSASTLGTGAGLLNIQGRASVKNTLFSDCYEYAVLGLGGTDSLNYCTIANYPATGAVRQTASLYVTNLVTDVNGTTTKQAPRVDVRNSIVWGAIDEEVYFYNYDDYKTTVAVQNSVLHTTAYAGPADVAGTATAAGRPGLGRAGLNNLFTDPKFVRIYTSASNDYHLAAGSPARASQTAVPPFVPRDLLNLPRSPSQPDLGAYQTSQ